MFEDKFGDLGSCDEVNRFFQFLGLFSNIFFKRRCFVRCGNQEATICFKFIDSFDNLIDCIQLEMITFVRLGLDN